MLKKTSIVIFSLFPVFFVSQKLFGQELSYFADKERKQKITAQRAFVDELFSAYARKTKIPGLAYAVMMDGQVVFSGGYGVLDKSAHTPASPQSLFRIASMTKSITAMAILKLRAGGKLQLDDPAHLYIPEMKAISRLTPDARAITIRDLLTHAAGFPEDNPWGDRQLETRDEDLLNLIGSGLSLSNVPGVAFEYSNLGFALLGRIIRNISGKPYQEYITQEILRPLGMSNTIWEYTEAPADRLAHGYRYENDTWKEESLLHDGAWGAMGGLITSIDDFSKYIAFHQSAWPPGSGPDNGPVSKSDLREMHHLWNLQTVSAQYTYPNGRVCPTAIGYGYGLRYMKDGDGRVIIGHSGGLPGFGSNWQIWLNEGIGIVSYANLTYAGMTGINTLVLDSLVIRAGLPASRVTVSGILKERSRQLAELLPAWNGAETSGIFAENFFPDKSLQLRKETDGIVFKKIGSIRDISAVEAENQLRGTFYITGTSGKARVFFTLSPEKEALIQQLNVTLVPVSP